LSEIVPNFAHFCPSKFFFGGPQAPKFWDLDYKIELASDHVAEFHGDWMTELGDLVVKKEITSVVNHKTAGNCSERPNNNTQHLYSATELEDKVALGGERPRDIRSVSF